jgi:ATP-binding cassette subfamily F protein 3
MSLLSARDLAKAYGSVDIFKGVTLDLPRDARIAIVGPNGVGKTTLLRILVGLEEPSAGAVTWARNLHVGYLPQEAMLVGEHTLWQECLAALADLRLLETELEQLEQRMSAGSTNGLEGQDADQLLQRYGQIQEIFERRGGYSYETRIRQILTGLGFDPSDFHRPIPQLSGGQRTRALLARLLLAEPDVLILDEPTNHLDIAAVEWLEGYLSQWKGAALIVSHDRYFLDRVVDHIWEMRLGGLDVYRGNYSAFVQQRQERWERLQNIYASQKERLEKELDYVKRNISGQRTLQAKGKLRRLSREVEAIQSLGFEALQTMRWGEISQEADISTHSMSVDEVEKRIRALRPPSNRPPQINLHLKAASRSGDLVLRTRDLAIGYPDEGRPLFRAPDLLLKRGECAAVIGPNGAGKTTFLKTLLEHLPPLEGEVILGASLKIGYFAQAHEDLRPERTLVEEIDAVAPNMLVAEVRNYLARFLFSGEDVFKKVAVLSGGERGRLALAKLSLSQANLLLLDEPTNHLDIPSQEILQEVLDAYQGTILLVSHDRYLIDALGTQIWEIQPDEAFLTVFQGDYSQYKQAQEAQKLIAEERRARLQELAAQKARPSAPSREEKKRRARIQEVEAHIDDLEAQLTQVSRYLENPPADPVKVQELGQEYVRIQEHLEIMLKEWEELHA